MKKMIVVLSLVGIVITILLVVIVKRGVIVRPQPLIKPTVLQKDFEPVARHVALRMFPEFQSLDYIIWNLDFHNQEALLFQERIINEYTRLFQKPIQVLKEGQLFSECMRPCWIFSNSYLDQVRQTSDRYIEFNWFNFDHVESIPEACINKKILDSYCVKFVSLKSIEKKLKDKDARYFFLHKYMDQSYYLFVQSIKN